MSASKRRLDLWSLSRPLRRVVLGVRVARRYEDAALRSEGAAEFRVHAKWARITWAESVEALLQWMTRPTKDTPGTPGMEE